MSTQHPQRKWHSIPLRRSAAYQTARTTTAHTPATTRAAPPDDEDEYGQIIPRTPSSVVRYTDEYGRPVIQQGNRRYVMHKEPPPQPKQGEGPPIHWGSNTSQSFYLREFTRPGYHH